MKITGKRFNEIFTYRDGILIWNFSPNSSVKKFDKADRGRSLKYYTSVQYKGVTYLSHRVIWQMFYGEIPDGLVVDHKDGNKWNNRISNLRLVTTQQNLCNTTRKMPGLKGAHFDAEKNKWRSSIMVKGNKKHLGFFENQEEAHKAYCKASSSHHGEFGNTGKNESKEFGLPGIEDIWLEMPVQITRQVNSSLNI